MAGGFPELDAVYDSVDRFVRSHGDVARRESLGKSAEGRDVVAVAVTDQTVPPDGKQVALVICGRHGSEVGTRVVGTGVLDWLASAEGVETRRRQLVVVVPVANPDGCARSEFHAPPWHLSGTEYDTIGELARAHVPDAVIDVHSFGESDADLQAIVTGNNTDEAEDPPIYHGVAARMIAGAARAGYPFLLHTTKRNEGYNNFISGYCYDSLHSLAFGMEVNHHVFGPEEAARGGAAVIGAMLAEGNARAPWQRWAGYPNDLLRGDFFTSVRPAGASASERRRSRAAIWRDRMFFRIVGREAPDEHTVKVRAMYTGYETRTRPAPFSLCCRVRGRHDDLTARVNGEPIDPPTFRDECSTYVNIDLHPSGREDYELTVSF